MILSLTLWSDWTLLIVRVALGLIMFLHGVQKMKDPRSTTESFNAMGFRPGAFWGLLVALIEVFGGAALILGLFTQIAAGLIAVQMAVATLWKISRKHKLIGGFELDLILFTTALALFTLGGGLFSLERYLNITLF